jgi:hypothetical protein
MRGVRPALTLAAVALLLLVVVAARGGSAVPSRIADPSLDRGLPGVPLGSDSSKLGPRPTTTPDVGLLSKILIVLVVVAFLVAVVTSFLAWRRNRRRIGVGAVIETTSGTIDSVLRMKLADAVHEARDLLARPGGDARDAVIAAWVTLESAVEHERAPHQTATEFTVALLEKETVDPEALRELRTLYQQARFGHRSEPGAVDRARDALDRILATVR